jgi:hypothetical protein
VAGATAGSDEPGAGGRTTLREVGAASTKKMAVWWASAPPLANASAALVPLALYEHEGGGRWAMLLRQAVTDIPSFAKLRRAPTSPYILTWSRCFKKVSSRSIDRSIREPVIAGNAGRRLLGSPIPKRFGAPPPPPPIVRSCNLSLTQLIFSPPLRRVGP